MSDVAGVLGGLTNLRMLVALSIFWACCNADERLLKQLSRSLRLRSVSRTPVQNVSISVSSLEVCETAALMANFPKDMANSPKDSSCSWVLYLSAA